ncbi:MAG: response regulator transcription factor [Campylobacterota bacterium]|nr:response regulator transcription factor [Campylobacterota bacterium]
MVKILLLEDDPNLAKSLVKYLQKHDYEVDWAKQGEEAIDFSYENKYDLYLFDVNVPLMSGTDVLSALRQAEDRTPTIIISAQIDIDSMAKGFSAGADDYVKKPFDPEELLLRIKSKTMLLKKSLTVQGYSVDTHKNEIYHNNTLCGMGEVQKSIFIQLLTAYPDPASKEILMESLVTQNDGALRVNIVKLKKETGVEIQAVRGVGYKIL